ncbi:MAG TPA: metallophosphoesterase [Ottowia sp.]|nr:metallophosphoesterase [Ottowia sp.]
MSLHIIGDTHGQAGKLKALLRQLGYQQRQGAYRHPDARAIFVGDFIDRGPHQLETLDIVRRMVDAGSALAIMGNHEFNAIAWHTPDPDAPGEYLRPRGGLKGDKNRSQHQAFLAELQDQPARHADIIAWFKTLPLWLDLPELRVVHACWHEGHVQALRPLLTPAHQLTDAVIVQASRAGSAAFQAVETLLKGIEVPLPDGHSFHDKDGHVRHNVRVRWWLPGEQSYRHLALLPDAAARAALPDTLIPAHTVPPFAPGKPLFFGHYWMTGTPGPLHPLAACVDYSAGKHGPLVAYHWEQGGPLEAARFVSSADT